MDWAAAQRIKDELPAVEILLFTGTRSHHILLQIIRSNPRGCLRKSEAAEEEIFALESLRHHRTFRSRGMTEVYEDRRQRGRARKPDRVRSRSAATSGRMQSTKEIAARLGIGDTTVDTYRSNLLRKLKLHSVSEVIGYAVRQELVER